VRVVNQENQPLWLISFELKPIVSKLHDAVFVHWSKSDRNTRVIQLQNSHETFISRKANESNPIHSREGKKKKISRIFQISQPVSSVI